MEHANEDGKLANENGEQNEELIDGTTATTFNKKLGCNVILRLKIKVIFVFTFCE